MEMKTKTKEKQRPSLGQRKFCSLFPTVPAFSCSSLPQELPGWGTGKHLKTTLQKGGDMENTLILHTWQKTLHWEKRGNSQLWMYPSKKSPVQTEIFFPFEAQRSCSNKNTAQEPPTNIWLQIWFQTVHLPTAKCASLQETSPAWRELSSAEHFLGMIFDINSTRSFNTFLVNFYFLAVGFFSPHFILLLRALVADQRVFGNSSQ